MGKPFGPLYGIPIKEIARRCAVSEKTATRWKLGTTCPPKTALWILTGDLGCFHPDWKGWYVHPRDGDLVSPEGWCVTVGDVLASPLQRALLATYRSENVAMKSALDALHQAKEFPVEQPLPADWGWDLSEVKVK